MFADSQTRFLQALRFIANAANGEHDPAAASNVIIRWLDRELRHIDVVIVPRTYKAAQNIDILGEELARAARGLVDDDQVDSTRVAIRMVIDDIEDDIDADVGYRLVS